MPARAEPLTSESQAMVQCNYNFVLELRKPDQSSLGTYPVMMDWAPAEEWARLMALREGSDLAKHAGVRTTVEPEWDNSQGEPYVGGVRVTLGCNGAAHPPVILPFAYFGQAAVQAGKDLVARKLLEPKDKFHYSVVAFRAPERAPVRAGLSLTVEEVEAPSVVRAAPCNDLQRRSTVIGEAHAADTPVFLPQRVLDHAASLTHAAGSNETAGILIGHICRDAGSGRIFVEVTDLIPAKHTVAETMQVKFTAETWTAVEGAIQLRRSNEIMVGWFHSHPAKFWCSPNCGPEARRNCPLSRSFFSADDAALHRAVFPMAHAIALLTTNAEPGLRHALFGWREGLIVQRGFQVLDAAPGLSETVANEAVIGESHEEACP